MEILELNPSRPSLPLRHAGWFVEVVVLIEKYKEYSEHSTMCLYFILLTRVAFYDTPDH